MTLVSCLTTVEIETTPINYELLFADSSLSHLRSYDTIDFSWASLKGMFHKVGSLFQAFSSWGRCKEMRAGTKGV